MKKDLTKDQKLLLKKITDLSNYHFDFTEIKPKPVHPDLWDLTPEQRLEEKQKKRFKQSFYFYEESKDIFGSEKKKFKRYLVWHDNVEIDFKTKQANLINPEEIFDPKEEEQNKDKELEEREVEFSKKDIIYLQQYLDNFLKKLSFSTLKRRRYKQLQRRLDFEIYFKNKDYENLLNNFEKIPEDKLKYNYFLNNFEIGGYFFNEKGVLEIFFSLKNNKKIEYNNNKNYWKEINEFLKEENFVEITRLKIKDLNKILDSNWPVNLSLIDGKVLNLEQGKSLNLIDIDLNLDIDLNSFEKKNLKKEYKYNINNKFKENDKRFEKIGIFLNDNFKDNRKKKYIYHKFNLIKEKVIKKTTNFFKKIFFIENLKFFFKCIYIKYFKKYFEENIISKLYYLFKEFWKKEYNIIYNYAIKKIFSIGMLHGIYEFIIFRLYSFIYIKTKENYNYFLKFWTKNIWKWVFRWLLYMTGILQIYFKYKFLYLFFLFFFYFFICIFDFIFIGCLLTCFYSCKLDRPLHKEIEEDKSYDYFLGLYAKYQGMYEIYNVLYNLPYKLFSKIDIFNLNLNRKEIITFVKKTDRSQLYDDIMKVIMETPFINLNIFYPSKWYLFFPKIIDLKYIYYDSHKPKYIEFRKFLRKIVYRIKMRFSLWFFLFFRKFNILKWTFYGIISFFYFLKYQGYRYYYISVDKKAEMKYKLYCEYIYFFKAYNFNIEYLLKKYNIKLNKYKTKIELYLEYNYNYKLNISNKKKIIIITIIIITVLLLFIKIY